MTYYELIKQASELFKLRMVSEDRCEGLLYPTHDCRVWAYGEAALAVHGEVHHYKDKDKWLFHAVIHGIDDGNLAIHANYSDEATARKLLKTFFDWIEEQCFQCPSKTEVENFCRRYGLTPCYG